MSEYPRVNDCLNSWCPRRTSECDKCDGVKAILSGWTRRDDGFHEVSWVRAISPHEPKVKNRSEWVVATALEALQVDAATTHS